MQTWDVGRFLAGSLPREIGSLRLTDATSLSNGEVRAWQMQFIPNDTPRGVEPPWKFRMYVIWEQSEEHLVLTFSSYAGIRLPKSARWWLEYNVRRYNNDADIDLVIVENQDDTLSLRVNRSVALSKDRVELLAANEPQPAIVQPFFESYAECIEFLLKAWKEGVHFGERYRALH